MKTKFTILYCGNCNTKFWKDDYICQLGCCKNIFHENCDDSCDCNVRSYHRKEDMYFEEYLEGQEEPEVLRIWRFLNEEKNKIKNLESKLSNLQKENNCLKNSVTLKDNAIRELQLKAQNPVSSIEEKVGQSVNNVITQTFVPRLERLLQNTLEQMGSKMEKKVLPQLENRLKRKIDETKFNLYSNIQDDIELSFSCPPFKRVAEDISTILEISEGLENSLSNFNLSSDWYYKGVLLTDIIIQDAPYTDTVLNLANIMELGMTSTDIKKISHFEKNEKISVAVIFTTQEMKDDFLAKKETLDPELSPKIFNFDEILTKLGYQIYSKAGIYVKKTDDEEFTTICCLYELVNLISADPEF